MVLVARHAPQKRQQRTGMAAHENLQGIAVLLRDRLHQPVVSSFLFQAEDGIRYLTVTGVQTCALPIFRSGPGCPRRTDKSGRYQSSQNLTLPSSAADARLRGSSSDMGCRLVPGEMEV